MHQKIKHSGICTTRRKALSLTALIVVLLCASSAMCRDGARPTNEQISRSMKRGVDFLFSVRETDGTWDSSYDALHEGGVESLIVLGILAAGEPPDSKRLEATLAYIDGCDPKTTYARAMRALLYARLGGKKYFEPLRNDTEWLIERQHPSGGWGYGPAHSTTQKYSGWTDASNTQLALLALQAAAEAGVEVPKTVWTRAINYWVQSPNADGGWGYRPPGGDGPRLRGQSYGSMTAAAAATISNLSRRIPSGNIGQKTVQNGIKWLDQHYTVESVPGWMWGDAQNWLYYYLHCMARLSDTTGRAAYGGEEDAGHARDFRTDAAAFLLRTQKENGSWLADRAMAGEESVSFAAIDTAFVQLVLARAAAPEIISYLSLGKESFYDPARPDAFCRWFGRQLNRRVGWRRASGVSGESPVLMIKSDGRGGISADMAGPLREFLCGGGTIVVVSPKDASASFAKDVSQYFRRILPAFSERKLKASGPLGTVKFSVGGDFLEQVVALDNSCQMRVFILSPSAGRQLGEISPDAMRFLGNVVLYATDMNLPDGRFAVRPFAGEKLSPQRRIAVARIKHGGYWGACPGSFAGLSRVLTHALSVGVEEAPPVDPESRLPGDIELLWLTGGDKIELGEAAMERLKKYVLSGGTVFIDSASGNPEFVRQAGRMLAETFGADSIEKLSAEDPLITGGFAGGIGTDITKVRYTRALRKEKPDESDPGLWCVRIRGRAAVIVSNYAITGPMSGTKIYNCRGLSGRDALRVASNVVLYAAMNQYFLQE